MTAPRWTSEAAAVVEAWLEEATVPVPLSDRHRLQKLVAVALQAAHDDAVEECAAVLIRETNDPKCDMWGSATDTLVGMAARLRATTSRSSG